MPYEQEIGLTMPDPVGINDVIAAYESIRTAVEETPIVSVPGLGALAKCESTQVSGSFKIRGALTAIAAGSAHHVVAGSSGNHGIALARAATARGVRATVFMSHSSSPWKRDRVRAEGADVVLCDEGNDWRDNCAREFAQREGATFVSSHDHGAVIAGQGTVGLEILRQVPDVTDIYVPVGGGGLLAGICVAARGTGVRIVGVEPVGAARYTHSLRAGHPVRLERVRTICDGVRAQVPGELAFRTSLDVVDRMITVPDSRTTQALALLATAGIRAEVTGALALAGLMADSTHGPRPVVVVSGGNAPVLAEAHLRP